MDEYLIPNGDKETGDLLERIFREENIEVYNSKK